MKKLAFVSALLVSLNASAALYDRGNGMIYDSDQNITWLQDANYAKTTGYVPASGYGSNGAMLFYDAQEWATSLVYNDISGWRLPLADKNEMENLYYELGNKGWFTSPNLAPSEYGFLNKTFEDADTHQIVTFENVEFAAYWYYTGRELLEGTRAFEARYGYLGGPIRGDVLYAWAVHDGDIAAVPVPSASILFTSGLVALIERMRRKK